MEASFLQQRFEMAAPLTAHINHAVGVRSSVTAMNGGTPVPSQQLGKVTAVRGSNVAIWFRAVNGWIFGLEGVGGGGYNMLISSSIQDLK